MSVIDNEFETFKTEHLKALIALDMEYARRLMPFASNDEVRLIAMHKARYEATDIPPELRHASAAWLRERGYKAFCGADLLPEGQLPE